MSNDCLIFNGGEFSIVKPKTDNPLDFWQPIKTGSGVVIGYRVVKNGAYYSKRYDEYITFSVNDKPYDGATGAFDITSFGWLVHDVLCRDGCFADGSTCNNWQASNVLSDILSEENRWFRSFTWFAATWLFGGGKARKNGMF